MQAPATFESLRALLASDRSIRRFQADFPVGEDLLRSLVELTRFCPSGRNLQPLRYRIVTAADERDAIFPSLAWAGYYTDWAGPELHERPSAYLIQCLDTALTQNPLCDEGLQLEAITLGAASLGLGCCIIKAFNAQKISEVLSLPVHLSPSYVLAIGKPAEQAKIVDIPADGDYKYYRDENGTQCVPKRPLDDLIIS